MRSLQRAYQDRLILEMRKGRLTRRVFLQRAQDVGLGSSIIALLLNGCASSTPSTTPTTITWFSEGEVNASQAFGELVQHFNVVNEHNIFVNHQPFPDNPEVVSVDVVWTSKFAANRWIIPLDQYWPEKQRTDYLTVPLKAASYQNRLWGAPVHTDAGVLFYRTDLPDVISPSKLKTWHDFIQMAGAAHTQLKIPYGFAWQGRQFEGLVCNFVEILSAYGGAIFDTAIPCLGGWQLAINSYAEKTKQDAAWEFISWMLKKDAQQYLAVKEAYAATLTTIYDDPYVQQANPFYASLKQSIDKAQSRPITPHYQCLANEIELYIPRALVDQTYQPVKALQDLQGALEKVLEKKPTEEDDCTALYQ